LYLPGYRGPQRKLLHISDIHVSDGMAAEDLETGILAGLAEKPDLICLTGDFVSHLGAFDAAGLVRMLRRTADAAPTFAVLGNHDGGLWLSQFGAESSTTRIKDLVQSSGVHLLDNQHATAAGLHLVGVGDLWSGEFAPERAFSNATPAKPTIVLCHNPDGKDALTHRPWHLMLSGHTHGGQGRLPGLTPLWTPVRDKSMISGLHSWQGRHVFITRGLGSPRHVRAFCRPEVSVLHVA
jgi:predicted MPP superfamily phosphohydrolase